MQIAVTYSTKVGYYMSYPMILDSINDQNTLELKEIEESKESKPSRTHEQPLLSLDDEIEPIKDEKYLNFIDQCHVRMNSKAFEDIETIKKESSSEIYSGHRLQSSSSEKESTLCFEETQGRLYVVKKIDDNNKIKIPHLDLGGIIEKQKKKMYPFNLNSKGEMVELTNKESSLETHNDEDAIIIYDEKDQEEDSEIFQSKNNQNQGNFFNSSFFSNLS